MAKINQNQKARELESRKNLGQAQPWANDKIARIRSLGRPMASRASKGNR
jgi:hypothetical protein